MDLYKRLGMYFFVIGALLAILAGVFPLADHMYTVIIVLLVFLGVFSALFNIDEDEEIGFIIAGTGFLLVIMVFQILLGESPLIESLARFFEVVTFFVGTMTGVVAIKTIVEYGSQGEGSPVSEIAETSDHMEQYLWSKKERAWNFIVFLAVAVSFVIILLDVFFALEGYTVYFIAIDIIITLVFIVDLFVLFRKERSFGTFLKHCWLDIIAAIPFIGVMRVLRIAKLARLVRIMRFVKLNKTLKFFSDKSGVKHYLRGKTKIKDRPSPPAKKAPKRSKK